MFKCSTTGSLFSNEARDTWKNQFLLCPMLLPPLIYLAFYWTLQFLSIFFVLREEQPGLFQVQPFVSKIRWKSMSSSHLSTYAIGNSAHHMSRFYCCQGTLLTAIHQVPKPFPAGLSLSQSAQSLCPSTDCPQVQDFTSGAVELYVVLAGHSSSFLKFLWLSQCDPKTLSLNIWKVIVTFLYFKYMKI